MTNSPLSLYLYTAMRVPNRRSFFKNLDDYFSATGMTQAELATALGVSEAYMSLIINGKRTMSLKMAKRIADTALIPLETLISAGD